MSDFQNTLDSVMKEQDNGLNTATNKKKKSLFSYQTFTAGLILGFFLISSLLFWAWVSSNKTQETIQSKLPSKTAIIDLSGTVDITSTLTIQPDISDADTNEGNDISMQDVVTNTLISDTEEKAPSPSAMSGKAKLSFIITELGLSEKTTKTIVENLRPEIGITLSPYAPNLQEQIEFIKKDGHNVFINLPLETEDYPMNDSGPLTLMTASSANKNLGRLKELLEMAKNYDGFVAQKNHIFNAEDANVNPAIRKIFTEGFPIIDSNTKGKSFLGTLAARRNYPFAQNEIWLDDNLTPEAINKKIAAINEYGQAGQNLIVMLRPYPSSIKALQKHLSKLKINV